MLGPPGSYKTPPELEAELESCISKAMADDFAETLRGNGKRLKALSERIWYEGYMPTDAEFALAVIGDLIDTVLGEEDQEDAE